MKNMKINNKGSIIIIWVLIVAIVALSAVSVWAIWFRETEPPVVLTPDYAPQPTEKNAEPIDNGDNGDNGEGKLQNPDGGGGVGLEYTKDVTISLSDEKVTLYFANPKRSTHDMLVQIVIQDKIIVQSGRLTPGNKVISLDLLDGVKEQLVAGVYEGKYVILMYQQETGEKAILNTEIPLQIKVND